MSSHPSAYNNFVVGLPAGISASKADLLAQIQAVACKGRVEYEITFMETGSDLQPKSLVISLLGSSGSSKHSSYLMVSAALVPALWAIARQHSCSQDTSTGYHRSSS